MFTFWCQSLSGAVTVIVGAVLSIVMVLLAEVLLFPALSVQHPADILTVCEQLPLFVTTSVYVVPLPLKVPFVPFVTVISDFANPVTVSLNSNVYVILLAFVGLDGFAVIVHVGAVLSK